MALSRPFLLALLGVALLGATFFAVTNARNGAADDSAPAAQQTADPAAPGQATPEPASPAAPQELLRASLTPDALESATFKGAVTFTSNGEKNSVKTSGAFEIGDAKEMPKLDIQVSAQVKSLKLDQTGGFVTTGDRAWFTLGDTGYAVPQQAWTKIVKARESGATPARDVSGAHVQCGSERLGEQREVRRHRAHGRSRGHPRLRRG